MNGLRLQERSFIEFLKGAPELLLSIHDYRAVPRYWFLQWLARDQEKADPLIATGICVRLSRKLNGRKSLPLSREQLGRLLAPTRPQLSWA
jgi:hypothetical protein